jgi:hypothetical protein
MAVKQSERLDRYARYVFIAAAVVAVPAVFVLIFSAEFVPSSLRCSNDNSDLISDLRTFNGTLLPFFKPGSVCRFASLSSGLGSVVVKDEPAFSKVGHGFARNCFIWLLNSESGSYPSPSQYPSNQQMVLLEDFPESLSGKMLGSLSQGAAMIDAIQGGAGIACGVAFALVLTGVVLQYYAYKERLREDKTPAMTSLWG